MRRLAGIRGCRREPTAASCGLLRDERGMTRCLDSEQAGTLRDGRSLSSRRASVGSVHEAGEPELK
jgi:hypothetical protein